MSFVVNSSVIQQQNEVFAIMGFVKSVNINTKTCIIFDVNANKTFVCSFEGFLPISDTDAIYGFISKLGGGYSFIKKPLVKVSVDKDTVIKSITKALKYQINNSLATKVYESCLIKADGDTVDEYLDNMAIDLHEKQIEDFGVLPDLLMESQVMKLLRWWYKSRTLRKLYLLGLNNKEIKTKKFR